MSESQSDTPAVWVMTDGRAGNVACATGLAEALGYPFIEKTITLKPPFLWMPPSLWVFRTLGIDVANSDALDPPWPDLLITCGRRSVGTALEIKRRSGGHTKAVHILDPHLDPGRFDLVSAPAHDRLSGPNVISTQGSLNAVSDTRLAEAKELWRTTLGDLPGPRIAVLIGGRSKAYEFDKSDAEAVAATLLTLQRESGGSLMVTASRRTGPEAGQALRDRLTGSDIFFWDGAGENPYWGFLAWADHIVVTGDSVNMTSEALATGQPVYTVDMRPKGGRAGKLERFHAGLRDAGLTRSFDGTLSAAGQTPLRETEKVAARVRELLSAR